MTTSDIWGQGEVIAGRYKLVQRLGKGGMGSVWSAEHLALHSLVAVKLIDPLIAGSGEALQRFMREAQSSAALRSPHVVQIFDYGVHEGVPFIAMEMLEGESLAQRLDRVTRLSPEETSRVVSHIARAMTRAHEAGIVHRDLKPDNVFLVKNEDEEVAKVLDFGIAKATGGRLGSGSQTRTGALLGTPYYMSPEQAEGNKSLDHRTDLWSMAVIAFECMTGRRPFESEALGDLILQICTRPIPKPSAKGPVPSGFDEWFLKATSRDPAGRHQSARELADGLRRIIAGESRAPSASDSALGLPAPAPAPVQSPDAAQSNGTTAGKGAVARTMDGSGIPSGPPRALWISAIVAGVLVAGIAAFMVLPSERAPSEPVRPASAGPAIAASTRDLTHSPELAASPENDVAPPSSASTAASAAPAPPVAAAVASAAKAAPPPTPKVLPGRARERTLSARPASSARVAAPAPSPSPAKGKVDFGF